MGRQGPGSLRVLSGLHLSSAAFTFFGCLTHIRACFFALAWLRPFVPYFSEYRTNALVLRLTSGQDALGVQMTVRLISFTEASVIFRSFLDRLEGILLSMYG